MQSLSLSTVISALISAVASTTAPAQVGWTLEVCRVEVVEERTAEGEEGKSEATLLAQKRSTKRESGMPHSAIQVDMSCRSTCVSGQKASFLALHTAVC